MVVRRCDRCAGRFGRSIYRGALIADVFLFVFGHVNACLARQLIHRFHKGEVFIITQKTNGIATHTAAKAVIDVFLGIDIKGGRLFPMKGAAALKLIACAFERGVPTNDTDQVSLAVQLF